MPVISLEQKGKSERKNRQNIKGDENSPGLGRKGRADCAMGKCMGKDTGHSQLSATQLEKLYCSCLSCRISRFIANVLAYFDVIL